MIESIAVQMTDSSKVAELRRLAVERSQALAWGEHECGNAALLATELATNAIKHAREGSVIVTGEVSGGSSRLRLIAVDHGPGIADIEACLADGYSTAGSPGTGLGALKRIAHSLDIVSGVGKGTVVVAELRGAAERPVPEEFVVGGVCLPYPGERVSGDGWDYRVSEGVLYVLLCDGLGHGLFAAEATRRAITAFRQEMPNGVIDALSRTHDALRVSRGAAAAVAMIDRRAGQLRFCGIGNIAAAVVSGGEVRHMVSHNGILGHASPRFAEFSYPWNASSQLVMHSDGLTGRWRPGEPPGVWQRSPAMIAGVLCRDWIRGRDDATAVVVRAA